MNKKSKSNLGMLKGTKIVIIVLLLFNVIFPIIFIWMVEISMGFIPDVYLTNGFRDVNPIKQYHIVAISMEFTAIVTSLFALYNLDKVLFKK